jgi:hypothetical protein
LPLGALRRVGFASFRRAFLRFLTENRQSLAENGRHEHCMFLAERQ